MSAFLIWILVGLLLIGAELLAPAFIVFFFGIGALVAALSSLIPGISGSIPLQIVIWLVVSGLSLRYLRKRFSRIFRGKTLSGDLDADEVGGEAEVTHRIAPGDAGRVMFRGTSWKAISYDETLMPGDKVDIVGRDGLSLVVTRPILEKRDRVDELPDPGSGDIKNS